MTGISDGEAVKLLLFLEAADEMRLKAVFLNLFSSRKGLEFKISTDFSKMRAVECWLSTASNLLRIER